jgi:hypothetical protein
MPSSQKLKSDLSVKNKSVEFGLYLYLSYLVCQYANPADALLAPSQPLIYSPFNHAIVFIAYASMSK